MKPFRFSLDGPVLTDFFRDRSEVSIIQGPVGSGTSTACCHKMWAISNEQDPDPLGVRKTRWVVVRNTFDDLKQTTLKTWGYWFVEVIGGMYGEIKMTNPPEHLIQIDKPDGSRVRAEFIFRSLDTEDDVAKLLSMEPTGFWFNEMQFTEKRIFDGAHSRAAQMRYPPLMDGGPNWAGIIGDLNAPSQGHWIPYMRGDLPMPEEWDDDTRREFIAPDNWKFFVQPPGLVEVFKDGRLVGYEENPAAENRRNLKQSYTALIAGKPKSWIDTYVMNRVGIYLAGKPVFESFRQEVHVSKEPIDYLPEWPLIVGVDFARNPAAIIGQVIRGQVFILDEFGMENVSAGTFAPLLKQRIARKFMGAVGRPGAVQFWGDPTGNSKGQATDRTPFQIFLKNGMPVTPAPGNNSLSLRIETVDHLLAKMVDGAPAMLISPNCVTLRHGMGGAYHYPKIRGTSIYHDSPKKDRVADFCDGLQYLCLGAGLGTSTLAGETKAAHKIPRKKKRFSLRR